MPKTDSELVEAARRGDADARDELVKRFQRQVVLLAGMMVNDLAEGEDLGQEAFVRAFCNLDLLADPTRFGAWLRRIVLGVSVDWLRAFRPDLFRGWEGEEEHLGPDPDPSALDRMVRGELVARVTAALAALPPRYRVPLRLFHLDGLSHAKIAESLGLPVGTVRSLVARARRRLVPLLSDYAPEAVSHVDELFEEQKMKQSPSHRFLHVANGDCTTDIIQAAGIPGTTSRWADNLHEGPVPAGLSDEELLRVRAVHLSTSPGRSLDDVMADLRSWRAALASRASYEELIFWYEHDLFDQLNLIQVLDHLQRQGPGPGPVSLICIGSFPGRPAFKGLGELRPEELASLLDTRQPVSPTQYSLAQRAWQAFVAPDPREIERLLETDTTALPFLAAALRRHLEEFPWTTDGLSRTERRLLELAGSGPIDLWAAFPSRVQEGETAYYISDGSLWQLVTGLADASPPLLTLDTRSRQSFPLPAATIGPSETGRAVLARQVDRVARCGLDRWLGGVHLRPGAPPWRWDPSRQALTNATNPTK